MKKSLLLTIIAVLAIAVVGVCWWIISHKKALPTVANFDECAAAGYPVAESYPRQCRAGNQTFSEYIGNELEKTDLIRITTPRPNDTIKSLVTIEGEARGTWFFEASFPIKLYDANNNLLGTAIAKAQRATG